MNPEHGEVVSAFVDGVVVDPDRLAEALTDPDAVAFLVTCARLRAEICGDDRRPSLAFYSRMEAILKPHGIRRFLGAHAASVPWPLVAGLAVAMLVAGLWTGVWILDGAGVRMPPVVRVVAPALPVPSLHFAPAMSSVPASATALAPPHPASVLRFGRPGDWREASAGLEDTP